MNRRPATPPASAVCPGCSFLCPEEISHVPQVSLAPFPPQHARRAAIRRSHRAIIGAGTVFNDANHNQIFDTGESGLPGWTVFLDSNRDSIIDPGEITAVTDSSGNYSIDTTGIPPTGPGGLHYFGLDLQVGSGGRWVNDTPTMRTLWLPIH